MNQAAVFGSLQADAALEAIPLTGSGRALFSLNQSHSLK